MIKVVIEASSKTDLPLSERIVDALDKLGIQSVLKVTSTSKAPQRYEAVKEREGNDIYSSLISIQKRVKQYLSMADETLEKDSQEAGRL